MASPNHDTLEKGITFNFGSWTCVADGLGGFINHLDNHQDVGSVSTNQNLPDNSAALAAGAENPPKDPQEKENFDLIKRYWTNPDAPPSPQDYNLDPVAAGDQFSEKIDKCITLA